MDKILENSSSNNLEANLHYLESQHPELSEIAKNLAHMAMNTTPASMLESTTNPNEPQRSLTMKLHLQDTKIQDLLNQQQKQSQMSNSNSNTNMQSLVENVILNQHNVYKPENQVTGVAKSSSFEDKTTNQIPAVLRASESRAPSGSRTLCIPNIPSQKYSDSSLLIPHQLQSINEQIQNSQETNQLLQYIIQNNLSQNPNLSILSQLLQSPAISNESGNVWSSIIQPLTKQLIQQYQQQMNAHNENTTDTTNNNNNSSCSSDNNNNNNCLQQQSLSEPKSQSVWVDGSNIQHNITETCQPVPLPSVQLTNQLQSIPIICNQDVTSTEHEANVNNISDIVEHEMEKLNLHGITKYQEMNTNSSGNWSNTVLCNNNNNNNNNMNDSVNTTNMSYSGQLSNIPRLMNQERLWMRNYHRDRFVVRITSVTYRCSCRTNTPQNRHRTADIKRDYCQGKECKRNDQRTYVTFQSQLPSLLLPDNARRTARHLYHTPLTGLRLGFTCPLTSQGPPMSDFNTPKVAERLDAWEQAGNQPGFRVQVLTALQQTVRQMLELIRTKGFGAVKLDTDYVFFPPASDLQPVYTRRRPLSSSSDGSLPRVMGLERIRREVSNDSKNHSFNTKLSESLHPNQKPEQSTWSDAMSSSEGECRKTTTTTNNNNSNIPSTSSGSIPRNRPRTWHQLPGHNSLVISSQNKSDYGINENLYERENDIYITRESFDSTPISTNQFTQNNTCWCTAQPMRCPTHHSLGYSSSLSSSPIRLNPNVHSVVNQMHLSPYSTVDERYLFKGNNKNITHQLQRHLDAPYSTPVSPTQFNLGEPTNHNTIHDCKVNPAHYQASTLPSSSSSSQHVKKLEMSRTPESCTSEGFHTADNNSQHKTEMHGRSDHLSKILQEISNCLHTNPQYPIVIMPTHHMLSSIEDGKIPPGLNKATPLVFQIPHSDSVFVGLPATSGVNPRVMTASPTNAVVILPSNQINQQSTSQQQQQHQDPPTSSNLQPTILTGPKQGYLLVITPDNKYEYLPNP
uniref:Uncharacterized protein n=1 Tax=Trichobilharzia regenti TaxID=157069 RepID=A0AA85K3J6_TRIRE|nr:unnamed protein product [Trichobilharzia regenti]